MPASPEVIDLPSQGFEIHTIWAWVAVDRRGHEGIITASIGGQVFPLTATTLDLVVSLERYARLAAEQTGKPVRLIRLDHRTVVREHTPPSS